VLNLACIALFFWFVQALGGSLRPIMVLSKVAGEGLGGDRKRLSEWL
jgi:hypothetical protein